MLFRSSRDGLPLRRRGLAVAGVGEHDERGVAALPEVALQHLERRRGLGVRDLVAVGEQVGEARAGERARDDDDDPRGDDRPAMAVGCRD